jgi:CBS domain-containing protein
MSSQTDIFRRAVRDCLGPPPPTAPHDCTVADAVACLAETRASALVLTDGENRPVGIVTEADVTRRVALQAEAGASAAAIMTAPVVVIEDTEYLYRGIARMRRNALRHLVVVDGAGRVAGMLHMADALASLSDDLVARIDRLSGGDETADALRRVKEAEVGIARDLLADGVAVNHVQGLITHVNNDLYRRVTRRILENMDGPPPRDFAVLVMGSGGRGENFLTPDQDNGLVIADYPDDEHDRIDGWFTDLAVCMTTQMDAIGLPFCTGNVMATNPLWRKTQTQWLDQIAMWLRRSNAAAVLLADIFFDFRAVAGDASLAAPVRALIAREMPQNRRFLGDMLRHHEHMHSPVGWFGTLRTDKSHPEHRGKIDLKRHGVQPVVAAARLLALRDGIEATSTLDRLEGLADAGTIRDAEGVSEAFLAVCDVLLRAQTADFGAGTKLSNHVAPATLGRARRKRLVEAFRVIDGFADGARAEISGRVL